MHLNILVEAPLFDCPVVCGRARLNPGRRKDTADLSANQRSVSSSASFGWWSSDIVRCSNHSARTRIESRSLHIMFGITFTRSLRDALPTTTARCVSAARTAGLPPIPIGPSSSRWASTYVHLGELADNKGARGDVSYYKTIMAFLEQKN